MKQNKTLLALIGFLFIAVTAQAAPVQRIREIMRPIFSVPAIVKAGDSFDIELKLNGDKKPATASLAPSGSAANALPISLTLSPVPENPSAIRASVPASAPEALYNLTVSFSDGSSDSQPHAVKILKEFKKDFDFVHLTDIHFNIREVPGKDTNAIRIRLLQDIAKLNPEFVIFTGDLGLSPINYDRDYVFHYEKFLEYLSVPFYTNPGNHDLDTDVSVSPAIDGLPYWTATYGPTYYSFDYDGIHFISINTHDWPDSFRYKPAAEADKIGVGTIALIGQEQWAWIKKDALAAAKAGKTSMAFTHIPVEFLQSNVKSGVGKEKAEGPSTSQFIQMMTKYKVSPVFVGHVHFNAERPLGASSLEIVTEAAGLDLKKDNDPHWGYRIVHVKDGKIAGYDIHEIGFEDLK
ncbi:MAG: metallophosphoesterase [bacterium]